MGVHANGLGDSWQENNPDVNQPHGLDYREHQDIRKGVRKRLAKQHVQFSDSTTGGEHIPGKCSVLLVQDTTAEIDAYFNGGGGVDASCAEWGISYCVSTGTIYYANDATEAWVSIASNIPAGGTTGQFLAKKSNTDFDVTWADMTDYFVMA